MDFRVMVASEVRLYRDALQRVLRDVAGIDVVGVASSVEEVVKQACLLVPSVVVIDMAMGESFSLAMPIARVPQMGGVVILSVPEVPAEIIACLPSSILGYVSRDGTVAVLVDAIRAAGRIREVQTTASIDDLTTREMEILKLMQQGLSNKSISRRLGIGLSTVKNHVHSILAKLGVACRGEAISMVYRHENSGRSWVANSLSRPADNETVASDFPDGAAVA
jgi:DNA-binding NarL/FixJ family response regulator